MRARPLPWLEIAITDPLTDEPVPTGTVREIRVRSGQNTAGYWRRPEETAVALTPDGWLRTGDAAWRDGAGYVYLHDRLKDLDHLRRREHLPRRALLVDG